MLEKTNDLLIEITDSGYKAQNQDTTSEKSEANQIRETKFFFPLVDESDQYLQNNQDQNKALSFA